MTLVRLLDQDRPSIELSLDGTPLQAFAGDTLLTAILTAGRGPLRHGEFGNGPRAGFCLMGACQDCWVFVEGSGTLRACTTLAVPGMQVLRR